MKLLLSILAFAAYTDASAQFHEGALLAAQANARERAHYQQQQQREDYLAMQREALALQREALELQREALRPPRQLNYYESVITNCQTVRTLYGC